MAKSKSREPAEPEPEPEPPIEENPDEPEPEPEEEGQFDDLFRRYFRGELDYPGLKASIRERYSNPAFVGQDFIERAKADYLERHPRTNPAGPKAMA